MFCPFCGSKQVYNPNLQSVPNETKPHQCVPNQTQYECFNPEDNIDLTETDNQNPIETYDEENPNRKWYYIGGGLLAALLVGGAFLFFMSRNSTSGTFAGKTINEVFPPIQKVVKVSVETANLRIGPGTEYVIALDPANAQPNAKLTAERGQQLIVLEDFGEWYKLALKDKNGESTYIKKSLCSDVSTTLIPSETVFTDWFNQNFECGGAVSIVRQPKGNRLVVRYTHVECDADELSLGVYQDGMYLFYYDILVTSFEYDETRTGISLKKESDDTPFYEGYYGKDLVRTVKYDWGESSDVDWSKVSEEQLADIFKNAIAEGIKGIEILTADDINEAKNQEPEDEEEMTGFSYIVDDGEFGLELYAMVGDKRVPTGISGSAEELNIIDQRDLDGNGEKEAIVYEWGGGNTVEPPYIVYYDKNLQAFKKVEGLEDMCDSSIKIENWKGKTSLYAEIGLRHDRYIYENHQLKLVERISPDVGKRHATVTVKQLFGDSEESEEKTISIDIDGDGKAEIVTFQHDTSHALDWGRSMLLVRIEATDWRSPENEYGNLSASGSSFTFLDSKNGEMPDILCCDAYLYKWNGERYILQE